MRRKWDWLAPLTGVLFVALVIVGFEIAGEPPDADEPVREIVAFYVDNKDSVRIGVLLAGLASVLLVLFGAILRRALRAAEGPAGVLSAVVLVGSAIMAVGIAVDATIFLPLAETADDIDPAAVQALQALWNNDFVPIAVGTELFLLSAGLSIVLHGALPRWLGWIAIVLAIVGVTPIGWVAALAGGVWVLVVSVMLALRARAADGAGHPGAAGPAMPA